jgi:hypothetical protein
VGTWWAGHIRTHGKDLLEIATDSDIFAAANGGVENIGKAKTVQEVLAQMRKLNSELKAVHLRKRYFSHVPQILKVLTRVEENFINSHYAFYRMAGNRLDSVLAPWIPATYPFADFSSDIVWVRSEKENLETWHER